VKHDRTQVLKLAAEAQVDPRTAAKALSEGIGTIKGWAVRARIVAAAKKLRLKINGG